MRKRLFSILLAILIAMAALFNLLESTGNTVPDYSRSAVAGPLEDVTPTVIGNDPTSAPNDLDTNIIITGTGFTAEMSGTVVITPPAAYLGNNALDDVIWVNGNTLSATVPWGLDPHTYALTVVNPDGISATLQNAFTVSEGIDVWTMTGGPYGGHISQVRIHPDTPTTVYAIAAHIGVFVSYDAGANWQPFLMEGFFHGIEFDAQDRDIIYLGERSRTMDAGQTWDELTIHTPIPYRGWNYRLTADPTKAGRLYAAAKTPFPDLKGGILRSDNYGAAGSWITLTEGISDTQFTVMAVHPADPNTLLAGTESGNLFYSQNGGQDWHWTTQIENSVLGLFFNPYEPLQAWATAIDPSGSTALLYKSTDLTTWAPVEVDAGQDKAGSYGWSLAFLPDKIWAGSWDVFTSTNSGDSWTQMPDAGGAMSLDVHPQRSQVIYIGEFSNGVYKSVDEGTTWRETNEGLAGVNPSSIVVAPNNPKTVYVKVDPSLFKSENGGQSWRSLNFGRGGYGGARNRLAIDPFRPERLYFGHGCPDSTCLWISENGGEGWTKVTAALPEAYDGWQSGFYTLAPHPAVPGHIFAGVALGLSAGSHDEWQGLFYLSDDYGATWNHVGPAQPIGWISEFAFDSQNPNLIYAATRDTGLWKSIDGGQNWAVTPAPAGFDFIDAVVTHPHLGQTVYMSAGDGLGGTESGLYVSYDAGENWSFLSPGIGGQLLFSPTFPPTLYGTSATGQYAGLASSTDDGQTWEQLEDAPVPICLATGSDGQRVLLYNGSVGALGTNAGTEVLSSTYTLLGQNTNYGGGVFRLTTILPTDFAYLPLVRGRSDTRATETAQLSDK